jgi:hypothetical protein
MPRAAPWNAAQAHQNALGRLLRSQAADTAAPQSLEPAHVDRVVCLVGLQGRMGGTTPSISIDVTSLRHHLLDDPVIDWLERFGEERGYRRDAATNTDFSSFIAERGRAFEQAVLALLQKRWPIVRIDSAARTDRSTRLEQTRMCVAAGEPLIAGACLADATRGLFGCTDLLVRSDVLLALSPSVFDAERVWRKANDRSLTSAEIAALPAPLLRAHHYRVVDIKFAGLHLDRRGHLGNVGSAPAFKGQVWLYNQMLGALQGYTPPAAFVLGRSWQKGSTEATADGGRACFDRLGPVFVDDSVRRGACRPRAELAATPAHRGSSVARRRRWTTIDARAAPQHEKQARCAVASGEEAARAATGRTHPAVAGRR